jgi:hypothetical protein
MKNKTIALLMLCSFACFPQESNAQNDFPCYVKGKFKHKIQAMQKEISAEFLHVSR